MAEDSKNSTAEKADHLATDPTSPDEDGRYVVTDRAEIIRIFRGLAKRKGHLLRAILSGGNDIPSMVLGVNPDANAVYVDCTASSSDNKRVEASSRIHYVTMIDGVKIDWISNRASLASFEGRDAFQLAIPAQVQRVQRRECYRLDTPLTHPLICNLRLADGKALDVTLVDVSVGGIGVSLPDSVKENLERGAVFPGCKIDFHGVGVVEVTLRVQMTWEITMKNGNISRRAGLEFVDLRSGAESMVQRYMVRLERERITNA